MLTSCFRGVIALLCLTCLISLAQAEDGSVDNDYARYARENTNGYIRFGRNDPFLRFGKRNDPFLRFGRQDPFLRFGRQDPFLRFGRNVPYLRFGRNVPYLRFGRNDPYLRFGKSDPFLRFGKSTDNELESDTEALTLAREHGFVDENEVNDRRKRSVLGGEVAEARESSPLGRQTREATDANRNAGNRGGEVADESSVREARNDQYMRFGKKNQIDLDEVTEDDRNFLENEFSRSMRASRFSLPRAAARGDHRIERKQEYMRFGRGI